MKKIKDILLGGVIGIMALNLNALTLDEAVNISKENNLDSKSSLYDYEDSLILYDASKGSFMPDLDLSYSYNDRDKLGNNDNTLEDSTASVTVSYNLFNGFSDLATLKSIEKRKDAFKLFLDATFQDIALQTKTDYLDYLNKRKSVITNEDAFKLFENQFLDAKNQYNQGLISQNDLLEVEVNMLNAKQNVISAKGDLEVARSVLSNTLGGYDLSNENIKDIEILESDFKELGSNIENRSEIKARTILIRSAIQEETAEKSPYYPTVDASFSHNEYGDDFGIGGRATNPDTQEIFNITATWNLFNGFRDLAAVKRKSIEVKRANLELDQLRLDVKLQYENALSNFKVQKANYTTSEFALKQAKKNYEIVLNRFNEGLSDNTDLIDANYLLSLAKENFNRAYYDRYLSYETLKRVLEVE